MYRREHYYEVLIISDKYHSVYILFSILDIYVYQIDTFCIRRATTTALSLRSVVKHLFEKHENVYQYHELTVGHLERIYQKLLAMKEEVTKEKSKEKVDPYGDEKEEEEDKETK